MKVILVKDVENLGKKYDVKEVKNGYARNFLLPQKLAKAATKKALKWLEDQKEVINKEAEFELKKSQIKLAEPIKELGEFPIKVGLEHNLEVEISLIITGEKSE